MLKKIGLLQGQMRDERVVAVITLDPALGHAVSEQSLESIKVPALVLGSLENDFLPYAVHSKYYANHIQGANLVGIEQGAGHFVYIDECNSDREVKGVSLCKDREGVDRKAIQKQILEHVFGFIYRNGFSYKP
ncbi:MAG: putative dienelactone hydrolase [Halieaceae bacterium]|jgi:predicted dienelactone hydrolase